MNLLLLLDYAGVALFAATGALAASRKQLDIVGFVFLATVTGVGGGTARDLILGAPVFWVAEPAYAAACAATAVMIFFTAHLLESRWRWLLWLDAAALAAYGVLGAVRGWEATGSAVVAVGMGVLTGTFGGILRDVLSNEPSVLLRREIYVLAAALGAAVYAGAAVLGGAPPWPAAAGFAAALALRGGA
ncbi:MAG: TRIC cation channel family protein, partial [Pseudomonadota bacterium]